MKKTPIKKYIKKIIKFIKKIFLIIINFILSLFDKKPYTNNNKNNTKKKKVFINNPKEKQAIQNKEEDNDNVLAIPKKSYIDFEKEFKIIIEDVTGIIIKDATYTQLQEITKVKDQVKGSIEKKEEIGYFTSKEDELKTLRTTIVKEVEKNKRLPLIKKNEPLNILSEKNGKKPIENTTKKKVIETKEIKEPSIPIPPNEKPKLEEPNISLNYPTNLENTDKYFKTTEEEYIIAQENKEEKNITSNTENPTKLDSTKDDNINLESIDVKENVKEILTIDDELISDLDNINILISDDNLSEEQYDDLKERLKEASEKIDVIIFTSSLNNKDEEKLQQLKTNIKEQEEKIPNAKKEEEQKENELLDEELKTKEINSINNLMEEIYKDNQNDLQDSLLSNIEELNNKSLEEIKIIEKQLLKKRLKKAARAIEPPLLLSLPFIKNKFFFGFTAGLFLHNHLNTIDSIYNRKTISYNPLDERKYIKGKRAMEDAIALNQNNFARVEAIKENYLQRYPELIQDKDFVYSITIMENKLQKQEERLLKSSTRFDHTKKKQNQIHRKLTLEKNKI